MMLAQKNKQIQSISVPHSATSQLLLSMRFSEKLSFRDTEADIYITTMYLPNAKDKSSTFGFITKKTPKTQHL